MKETAIEMLDYLQALAIYVTLVLAACVLIAAYLAIYYNDNEWLPVATGFAKFIPHPCILWVVATITKKIITAK